MTYKIDDDVPLPAIRVGRPPAAATLTVRSLRPGQSAFFPEYSTGQSKAGNKRLDITRIVQSEPTSKWTTRTVTENGVRGVRVWRTA
jgi:hypothetical protein